MDKKKILIIDDEADFCNLAKKNIEHTGEFEVSIATGGRDGFEMAQKIKPDLILLDILMPEMDGGDVASSIRNDKTLKDTPIVFLTAIVKENEQIPQLKEYIILPKTVSVADFLACIRANTRQI